MALQLLIEGQPDMTVVGEASDGAAAVQLALECRPDVIVMDVSMPGMNGLVATRTLKKVLPGVAVVTLTRHADDAYLQELLRAGASAYVLKQSPPTELLQAIRSTARQRAVRRFQPDAARHGTLRRRKDRRDRGHASASAKRKCCG